MINNTGSPADVFERSLNDINDLKLCNCETWTRIKTTNRYAEKFFSYFPKLYLPLHLSLLQEA